MLKQARELLALPASLRKSEPTADNSDKKNKDSKLKLKSKSKAEKIHQVGVRRQKQNKNGKTNKRETDKSSKTKATDVEKVSEQQFEQNDGSWQRQAIERDELEEKSNLATLGANGLNEHQQQQQLHNQRNGRHQTQSSSSAGSSSGYLSQTNGHHQQHSMRATLRNTTSGQQQPKQQLDGSRQDGAADKKPSGRQNGSYHLQQQQQHQSHTRLGSAPMMIDARQSISQRRLLEQRHLCAPAALVPMMIDDDDDGGGEFGLEEAEVSLGHEDEEEEEEDEDLDVRQMLASHRDRRRRLNVDGEGAHLEQLSFRQRQQLQLLQHHQHLAQHHQHHRANLIDNLPGGAQDDKLSRRLPSIDRHHANSEEDDDELLAAGHNNFNRRQSYQTVASVNTFSNLNNLIDKRCHQAPTSYLFNDQLQQPKSLDQQHLQLRQRYLEEIFLQQQHQQQQLNNSAIHYQPNLIPSEQALHHHQQQQKQFLSIQNKPTYERPRYLQSSNSFLYHQPYASLSQQQQRHHHLLNKPVPPVPPPQSHLSKVQQEELEAQQQRLLQKSDAFNQNHLHLNGGDSTMMMMMQTSGSRQHLTTSPERGQHHHHHHQNSSSLSSSPHSRSRNNLNSNNNHTTMKNSATMNNLAIGSAQMNSMKQNQRATPIRSTPTPTHMMHANGPPGGNGGAQMLPGGCLAGEPPPPPNPMSCCGKFAKFLLFVANALFWSAGIALGAWGILALVEDHKYNLSQLLVFEPSSRASLFQLLSWSFITLGCATILVGFCGCSAMFKNSRWILGLYIFLILAIFALDLATGLLAIIFQERLVANVRLRLVNKLRTEYGIQASFTAAIDYIQTRYECCGLDGHFDYDQSLWRLQRLGGFEATVARTCCHLRNTFDDQAHVNPRPVNESMCQSTDVRFHQSYRYRRGCLDDLERLIRHKIWNFTIGCGAVGAIILMSLVFATCFCRSIPNNRSSRKSSADTATGSRVYHTQAAYLESTTPSKKSKHSSSYR